MERARPCVCAHNFVSAEQFAHLSGPCSGRPETGMYRHMMLFTRKHHQSGHAEVGERASVAIKPCQLIRQACASSATGQAVQSICAISLGSTCSTTNKPLTQACTHATRATGGLNLCAKAGGDMRLVSLRQMAAQQCAPPPPSFAQGREKSPTLSQRDPSATETSQICPPKYVLMPPGRAGRAGHYPRARRLRTRLLRDSK